MDRILERNRLIDKLRQMIAHDLEVRVRKLLYILDPEEFHLEVQSLLHELDLLEVQTITHQKRAGLHYLPAEGYLWNNQFDSLSPGKNEARKHH
jgi:hypothetical protein